MTIETKFVELYSEKGSFVVPSIGSLNAIEASTLILEVENNEDPRAIQVGAHLLISKVGKDRLNDLYALEIDEIISLVNQWIEKSKESDK